MASPMALMQSSADSQSSDTTLGDKQKQLFFNFVSVLNDLSERDGGGGLMSNKPSKENMDILGMCSFTRIIFHRGLRLDLQMSPNKTLLLSIPLQGAHVRLGASEILAYSLCAGDSTSLTTCCATSATLRAFSAPL